MRENSLILCVTKTASSALAIVAIKRSFGPIFCHERLKMLPESHHKLRDNPCFEIYLNRDPRRAKPENLKTEIYIPIE